MHTRAKTPARAKRIETATLLQPAGRAIRARNFCNRIAATLREKFKVEPFQSVTDWAAENRYLSQTGAEFWTVPAGSLPISESDSRCVQRSRGARGHMASSRAARQKYGGANVLGFIIDKAPCSVLWCMPSRESVGDFLKDELEPIFAASPRLKAKMKAGAVGTGRTNSIRRKTFQNGVVSFVGGGSSTAVSFRTVKVVVLDELDKLRPLPEGDADSLAGKRVSTFGSDFKIFRLMNKDQELIGISGAAHRVITI